MAEVLSIIPLEGTAENEAGVGLTPSDSSEKQQPYGSLAEAAVWMSVCMGVFMHILMETGNFWVGLAAD